MISFTADLYSILLFVFTHRKYGIYPYTYMYISSIYIYTDIYDIIYVMYIHYPPKKHHMFIALFRKKPLELIKASMTAAEEQAQRDAEDTIEQVGVFRRRFFKAGEFPMV